MSTDISMSPRISVVIVSYRSRDSLDGCLGSLRTASERIPLQVVVVDNASGDGTVEWLAEQYPEVERIANATNRGFTYGVNQGLERARGDALLLLNPDCLVTAEALESLMRALARRPRAAAVAPMLLDGEDRIAHSCGRFPNLWTLFCDHMGPARWFPDSRWFGYSKYGGHAPADLDQVDWASGAALLVSRSAYEVVGGLDQNIFMYMEEVDWCRRAAQNGLAVYYVPQARLVHFGQRSARQVPVEIYLHNLRSRVYYFRKHHGALAAWVAKTILIASLILKYSASTVRAAEQAASRMYAAGLVAVWQA